MEHKEKANPANAPLELPKGYRPMTTQQLRLEVPERPGWHRRWFRGNPGRLARAQQAGYRFVDEKDCDVNNHDLAGDSTAAGSTDLGSRVSVISGESGQGGQPTRMYLMECPMELYEHGRSILEQRNDQVAAALRGGTVGAGSQGESQKDVQNRYVMKNTKSPSLLTKHSSGKG
jgi:hypothetical protein